jgi:hypothetical protein
LLFYWMFLLLSFPFFLLLYAVIQSKGDTTNVINSMLTS